MQVVEETKIQDMCNEDEGPPQDGKLWYNDEQEARNSDSVSVGVEVDISSAVGWFGN